jgi:hypothetical protein
MYIEDGFRQQKEALVSLVAWFSGTASGSEESF